MRIILFTIAAEAESTAKNLFMTYTSIFLFVLSYLEFSGRWCNLFIGLIGIIKKISVTENYFYIFRFISCLINLENLDFLVIFTNPRASSVFLSGLALFVFVHDHLSYCYSCWRPVTFLRNQRIIYSYFNILRNGMSFINYI